MASLTSTPQTHGPAHVIETLTRGLRAQADVVHAAYPQYLRYWDTWGVIEVIESITTKGGLRFAAGDVVLVEPFERHTSGFRTCYSFRGQVNVSVPVSALREILVDEAPETH